MIEVATKETSETKKEVKRVKFEDFDPKEAGEFLSGWKYYWTTKGLEGFSCKIDGEDWQISTLKAPDRVKEVKLLKKSSVVASIRNVEKVELNYNTGMLSFFAGKGSYHIAAQGLIHNVISPEVSAYIRLGKK